MKILVVSGATGGHIFPALSLIERLKARDTNIRITLVVSRRCKVACNPAGVTLIRLPIVPISLRLRFRLLYEIGLFLESCVLSFFTLIKFKPDVVVGFGSIDSVPVVSLAWFLRIHTVIHEQNVIPGKANKFLAKIVDHIAVSFECTKRSFGVNLSKISFTGNFLRSSMIPVMKEEAYAFFGFSNKAMTILVTGGSQGSSVLNRAFIKSLPCWGVNRPINIIHITGKEDFGEINAFYQASGFEAKVFAFLDAMHYAYSISDCVISRAGATTIAELIYFSCPAILVPYPHAYAHQKRNARVLVEAGCAVQFSDEEFSESVVMRILEDWYKSPQKLQVMREHYKKLTDTPQVVLIEDLIFGLHQHTKGNS